MGNWFSVIPSVEGSEGFYSDFEVRDVVVVEVHESHKGVKALSISGQLPIADHVELGCCRAIADWCEVVTDVLHTFFKELALIQSETNSVFLENLADAFEVGEDSWKGCRPDQNIVNDSFAPCLDDFVV